MSAGTDRFDAVMADINSLGYGTPEYHEAMWFCSQSWRVVSTRSLTVCERTAASVNGQPRPGRPSATPPPPQPRHQTGLRPRKADTMTFDEAGWVSIRAVDPWTEERWTQTIDGTELTAVVQYDARGVAEVTREVLTDLLASAGWTAASSPASAATTEEASDG